MSMRESHMNERRGVRRSVVEAGLGWRPLSVFQLSHRMSVGVRVISGGGCNGCDIGVMLGWRCGVTGVRGVGETGKVGEGGGAKKRLLASGLRRWRATAPGLLLQLKMMEVGLAA